MDIVLQTNIFFYITSAAVILVTVLLIIMLYYVITILRDVKDVSEKVRQGSEVVADDLSIFRARIKKEGFKIRHILDFFIQLKGRRKKKK